MDSAANYSPEMHEMKKRTKAVWQSYAICTHNDSNMRLRSPHLLHLPPSLQFFGCALLFSVRCVDGFTGSVQRLTILIGPVPGCTILHRNSKVRKGAT